MRRKAMGSSDVTFGCEENGGGGRDICRVESQRGQNNSLKSRRNSQKKLHAAHTMQLEMNAKEEKECSPRFLGQRRG